MNQPLISIVVPIYKVPEQYLRKCIESIATQTYQNIEIILVDDGSPDHCGDICEEYAIKDKRILVIHKKNGGLSSARNSGYRIAHGQYLMFVDGDDWIDANMCEEMFLIAYKKQVQLVMSGMVKEYGKSSKEYSYYILSDKVYEGKECKWLKEQLLHFNGNISMAYCKLIEKSVLDDNGIEHYEELKQGAEGIEFNIRLFECINSAYFINKPFYHYIYNENSISAKPSRVNNAFVLMGFESIKHTIMQYDNCEKMMYWFYNRLAYVIITTVISGFFNPEIKMPFIERKNELNEYLKSTLIIETFNNADMSELDWKRKVTIYLIKKRYCLALFAFGFLRRLQKNTQ